MSRIEALNQVKMYQASDWEVTDETETYFLLKKNTASLGGHVLVFILTFWWTFGIGNLVYWLLSNKKKKVVK